MRRQRFPVCEAGYTLVELLVVIAIIGMLASAAMPMIAGTRPVLEAKATARAVEENLSAARQAAINSGEMQRVFLRSNTRLVTLPSGKVLEIPKGATIRIARAKGNEIDFFPDGSTNGGEVTISLAKSKRVVLVRWPVGQISSND